jgi:quercetin dioxygenase-like cupin family protein
MLESESLLCMRPSALRSSILCMTNMNRRDLCVALSSLATLAAAIPAKGQAGSPEGPVLSEQKAYPFDKLPVKTGPNGETRAILQGVLPTGESLEVHETALLPGHMPHPAHKHRHSELVLIREGTVQFDNDGTFERAGAGGVFFAASGVMHGIKNVGETTANYFIVTIGHE